MMFYQEGVGAFDIPDDRDYLAIHVLGDNAAELPKSVNLDNTPSHNQGKTWACTAFALAHVVEGANTDEFKMFAMVDPNEQWANQKFNAGPVRAATMDSEGDSLQNALYTYIKNGLYNKNPDIHVEKFKGTGYAKIENLTSDIKKWLSQGYRIYTGSGNHCFCLVGYNDDDKVFIAKNSYGIKWGKKKNGTFDIPYDDVGKLFTKYIIYDKKDIPMIFKDVSENSPMAKNIKRMLDLGIMRGYGVSENPMERSFMPNQPVTRAELAEVIGNFIDKFGFQK